MGTRADRLQGKAASLYGHVRDRRELLELLAESILDPVRPARGRSPWRPAVLDAAAALGDRVAAQKDANRILLEVPESLANSATYTEIKRELQSGGLQPDEASEVALMVMVDVITAPAPTKEPAADAGSAAPHAIDPGSRGRLRRPGSNIQGLIPTRHDP